MGTLMNLFHLTAFSAYSFTLYQAFFNMDIPLLAHRFKKFDPGQLKYLTIWGVIAQTVFFFLCILNDLYGSNKVIPKRTPALRRIKDYFHAAFGFPLAMFVGVVFWSLMFVDRELVLPKALDPYFPWWLNHLMHTMVVVSTVIEMLVAPRQYPKRSYGFGGLALVMLSYLVWIHFIYYKSGIWVYPVMEVLSLPMRIVFLLALLFFCSLLYLAGEGFDHLLWGNEHSKQLKSHSKHK